MLSAVLIWVVRVSLYLLALIDLSLTLTSPTLYTNTHPFNTFFLPPKALHTQTHHTVFKRIPKMRQINLLFVALGFVCLLYTYLLNNNHQPSHPINNPSLVPKFTDPSVEVLDKSTTIIITSNLIPSHPSINMINETFHSAHKFLIGLSPTVPVIITCDGLKDKTTPEDTARYDEYLTALKSLFNERHHHVLRSKTRLGLTWNIKQAMELVDTEFVYLLQHDMPFILPIKHQRVIKSMNEYSILRVVRFNKRRNIPIPREKKLFGVTTVVDDVNGVKFTRTSNWSDNNHLTRKSYWEEIFPLFNPNAIMPPEWKMMGLAKKDEKCLKWCTFLYGGLDEGPVVGHSDGRKGKTGEGL